MAQQNNSEIKIPKYQYGVYVWGGFWNEENIKVHGIADKGAHLFDTWAKRQEFLIKLEEAKLNLSFHIMANGRYNDNVICSTLYEGCDIENLPVIHRLSEYKGIRYYSTNEWNWPEKISVLRYYAEYKWYPGFNDHVIEEALPNEEVDYTQVKILSEWVTGAFKLEEED